MYRMQLLTTALVAITPLRPPFFASSLVTTTDYDFRMPWEVTGPVIDCECDVELVNEQIMGARAALKQLVGRPFFRIFKVNLDRSCKFFPDDGTCGRESCAVATCCEEEIPLPWLDDSAQSSCKVPKPRGQRGQAVGSGKCAEHTDNAVDFTLLTKFDEFGTFDNGVSIVQDGSSGSLAPLGSSPFGSMPEAAEPQQKAEPEQLQYVNLQKNPERYTGYTGYTATRSPFEPPPTP